MDIRSIIENNRMTTIVVTAVIIMSSAILILRGGAVNPRTRQIYFYDLGTGKLFTANKDMRPPIDAPSGPGKGVRAIVFGCGSCRDADLRVAFIMKYSDDAIASPGVQPSSAPPGPSVQTPPGMTGEAFVAVPPAAGEQADWVSTTSRAGTTIQSRASFVCGQKPAQPCYPK